FAIGSKRQDYILSLNDPYFNDSKMSVGLDLFNTKRESIDFDEHSLGCGVTTNYPLKDFRMPFFGAARKEAGSDELAGTGPTTLWAYMRGGGAYDLTRGTTGGIDGNPP